MSLRMARELPVRACLSGPAAGVQGALHRASLAGIDNIVTLDVGGTSADVALLQNGLPVELNSRELAGFPLRIPSLDVNAVGAGGGSIAWIDKDGLIKVGPQSAGAVPGPVCYDAGGTEPTVTDANVMLGRLNGNALLGGRMPIRRDLSVRSIGELAARLGVEPEETALGIIDVACATMVKAIRAISVEKGLAPSSYSLFVYGGAGALHAVGVARELGIRRIVVPPSPGILCAEGAMNAPLMTEFVSTILSALSKDDIGEFRQAKSELDEQVAAWFAEEDAPASNRETNWNISARYFGQNHELTIPVDVSVTDDLLIKQLEATFHETHERSYGFSANAEPIQLVNLSVKAVVNLERPVLPTLPDAPIPGPTGYRDALFAADERHKTPVYTRASLVDGQMIRGPAIVEQMDATVLIYPGDECRVDEWGNIVIELERTE